MTQRCALVTGPSGGIGSAVYLALTLAGYQTWRLSFRSDDFVVKPDTDILVLCHAAPTDATFERVLQVDVTRAYDVICGVIAHMQRQGWGRIITFSSIRAHHPRPSNQIAYATAKSAMEGLTRALAVEYGRYGVTANCIAPGAVLTPRTERNIAAGTVSMDELVSRTPAGRLPRPEEIAKTVLWLASDDAAMVNGQVITIDGGWSVRG